MSDKLHLTQRRQTWYAQVRVPDSLYPIVGKHKIVRSLKTRDFNEAKVRKHAVVGEIKSYLASLSKQDLTPSSDSPQGIIEDTKLFMKEVDLGLHGDREEAIESHREGLEAKADDYHKPAGKAAVGVPIDQDGYREDADPKLSQDFRVARRILDGNDVLLASQALEDHLEEVAGRVRVQTVNARRRRVKDFLNWMGGDKELKLIPKKQAGLYLTQKLMKSGKSTKTVKDTLSDISAFFNWTEDRGLIDANPFNGLTRSVRETTRGTKEKKEASRRPFTTEELKTYLSTIKDSVGADDPVWGLTVIALFTGMRPNEICEIELPEVYNSHIHVPEAKTESSIRDVPIHPLIKPIIKKLKKSSKDGYLLSGLKRGGEDDKRYAVIGKRVGYLLRKNAKITDNRVVFYSLRKNFSTILENAGIPQSTAEQIVGHSKQSMTYGLYSHGVDMDVLTEAIQKVSYGEEVDGLVGNYCSMTKCS